ncbi:hypothetical protein [Streptomyces echinatus]|uniref:hypothetical protein n=1 Tax=Streptomyces echinatus TaxID=67293 RepID=UPI00379464A2
MAWEIHFDTRIHEYGAGTPVPTALLRAREPGRGDHRMGIAADGKEHVDEFELTGPK